MKPCPGARGDAVASRYVDAAICIAGGILLVTASVEFVGGWIGCFFALVFSVKYAILATLLLGCQS